MSTTPNPRIFQKLSEAHQREESNYNPNLFFPLAFILDTHVHDNIMTEEFQPLTFPPEVLARISPELSLQRHLAIGVRPNLRTFNEFRDITTTSGGLSRYNGDSVRGDSSVLGSSVLRSGGTMVVCTISGGIIEEDLPAEVINEDAAAVNAVFAKEVESEIESKQARLDAYTSVYPVVEVERGRVGAPTDEEMILSQKLYETILHSGMISKDALKVNVGLRSIDTDGSEHIYYRSQDNTDDDESSLDLGPKRAWSYVLYAKIKVFSRSGPLFDLVWASVVAALKNTNLPRAYIDENAAGIKIPIKIRGNFGSIREQYQITCDAVKKDKLVLNEDAIGFASNFGIIDIDQEAAATVDDFEEKMDVDTRSVLLADLEGEEEELTAKKTVDVTLGQSGKELKSLTVVGGVSKSELKQAIKLARQRSEQLQNK